MSKRAVCVILAVLFLFTAVLSACGTKGTSDQQQGSTQAVTNEPSTSSQEEVKKEEPITLKVSADATALNESMFKALFDGFQNTFANVKLETDVVKDIQNKLAPLIAAGSAPDVMYVGNYSMSQFMDEGKIMELSDFFQSKALDTDLSVKDSLLSGNDQALTYKGKIYGVPQGPAISGLVVNEKMFKENGWKVPTNWDELISVSKQIKAKGITPIGYGVAGNKSILEVCLMTPVEYKVGGEQFIIDLDNMKPGAWGSQQMVDSFKLVKELVDNGVIDSKGLGIDPTQAQVAFLQGKYAMCLSGYWFEMEMKEQMKDMEIGLIAFPFNKAGDAKQAVRSSFNTWMAWNTDNPGRKEAIWNFMKYLVGYEFQKKLTTEGGLTLVANKKVMEEMGNDPNASYFTKAVAKCISDPNVTTVQQKYQSWYVNSFRIPDFLNIINNVVAGKATPEQAAANVENLADKLRKNDSIIKQVR